MYLENVVLISAWCRFIIYVAYYLFDMTPCESLLLIENRLLNLKP